MQTHNLFKQTLCQIQLSRKSIYAFSIWSGNCFYEIIKYNYTKLKSNTRKKTKNFLEFQ